MKVLRSRRKKNWKRQDVRKEEATLRQERYSLMTPQQKLEKLGKLKATKQRKKLGYEIANSR